MKKDMKTLIVLLIAAGIITPAAFAFPVFAQSGNGLVPANTAFATRWERQDGNMRVSWIIDPCCMVYADRIIVLEQGKHVPKARLHFSRPPVEDNDLAGNFQRLYTEPFSLVVHKPRGPLTITFQGCNSIGYCYPPQEVQTGVIQP